MTFSGDQMFKKDKDPAMLRSFKNAVFLDTNEFFGERANATKIALKMSKNNFPILKGMQFFISPNFSEKLIR